MVRTAPSAAVMIALLSLCASLAAVEFSSSLSLHQLGTDATTTTAQAVRDLLPLAAMAALLTAFVFIYGQLRRHPNRAAGGATDAAAGTVCVAAAVLQYLLLHDGDGTRPRAVGAAAAHVLPAAATATFFLSMALVFVFVHSSGVAPGAGDGPVQAPVVRILTKLTLGAAAGVIGLMALALYG